MHAKLNRLLNMKLTHFCLLISTLLPSMLMAGVHDGLEISLIAESKTITPGKPMTLGVHLKHKPGFHTYWKSPGIVGMPTQLEWKLPDGFSVSEIQWPYPEKSFMAEYPCHGYERDVTLLVTLNPPKTISTDSISVEAFASWMCCAKECFPGTETLKLPLQVSDTPVASPVHLKLIEQARQQIPKANPLWKASVLSKIGAPQIKVLITPPKGISPKSLYLFSEDGQISSDKKQLITYQEDGSIIVTVPRSELDDAKSTNLPLILKADNQYVSICPVYKNLHSQ